MNIDSMHLGASQQSDPATGALSTNQAAAAVDDDADEWVTIHGVRIRKGMPIPNMAWQVYAEHLSSLGNVFGVAGEFIQALPGAYHGPTLHNLYFDWVFRVSDEPITMEMLTPSEKRTEEARLGHGEFVTWIEPRTVRAQLWIYEFVICEKWGTNIDLQQFVVDTNANPVCRVQSLNVGPRHNGRQWQTPYVNPADCDPGLLDPDQADSFYGRMVVMHLRGGPTPEQADRVLEKYREEDDPHLRREHLRFMVYVTNYYATIGDVLGPKLEVIMKEDRDHMGAGAPDPYLLNAEQRRNVNRNLENMFPEYVLKQSRLFVESDTKRAESDAKRAESDAKRAEAEADRDEAAASRVRDRVDGIKVILARRHIDLQPEELAELESRAIDELPSFQAADAVKTHEEFIEVAKLNGYAGTDSNDIGD